MANEDVTGASGGTGGTDAGAGTGSESLNQGQQPVDINDDTPIRGVPGFSEPVRYGDLYKRLQGDYTRKTQAIEKARKEWEAERTSHQTSIQQERARLESLAQTLIQQRQGATPGQADPLFAELSAAKYIDGPSMGKFITALQEKGFAPIVQAFKERDQIIQGLYAQITKLNQTVQTLNAGSTNQGFEAKISKWVADGGYPPEAALLAKEMYLAYEGDDLDEEFPTLFKNRWDQLQTLVRTADRKRAEDARRLPRLPGRGGAGTAGKPIGLKGNESPKQVADALWDTIQSVGSDT